MNPRVAVVMANYNKGAFVEEAIESILAQTMPDFECVVFDDGSTDGSLEIIHRLAPRDRRLTVRTHPGHANKGVNETMRAAVECTTAPFLAPLDSDDKWVPRALDVMLDRIGDAGTAYAKARMVDEAGQPNGGVNGRAPDGSSDFFLQLLRSNSVCSAAVLMRRDAYLDAGGFRFGAPCQDLDLWLRLAATSTMTFIDEFVADYRMTASSLNTATHLMHGRFGVYARHIEGAASWPGLPAERAALAGSYARAYDALEAIDRGEPAPHVRDDDVDALLYLLDAWCAEIPTLGREPGVWQSIDLLTGMTTASRERLRNQLRTNRRMRKPGPRTMVRQILARRAKRLRARADSSA
jgi:glycosyltransferase involved in cell wall biosynthesis